jgi:phosphoglycerate dehydrogenase-like enzyme
VTEGQGAGADSPAVVVNLQDRRPIWAFPEWAAAELREVVRGLPALGELYISSSVADGSGDGAGGPAPDVLEALRTARVYMGYGIPPVVLEAAGERLEWVHTGTAGVGGSLHPEMLRRLREGRLRFTNSAGIHGPPIAETVVGMLLHFFRGLDFAVTAQSAGRWDTAPFLAADTPVGEIGSSTVGILGYGGIGREVARRLLPFGGRVLGLRRSPPPDGRKLEDGVELLHGPRGLETLLAESDALVVAAPETPDTRGILDAENLRALRPGAILVNVARGSLVDEDALVECLRDGHLRGAGLDVFHREPLPGDSPLYTLPNVLLTPHVSGVSRGFWRREMDLIAENLRRFAAGEPLRNAVDPGAGY